MLEFIMLSLMSCAIVGPAKSGPMKGTTYNNCALTYPKYFVRKKEIKALTVMFHSFPTTSGAWKINAPYCVVRLYGYAKEVSVEQQCAEILKQLKKPSIDSFRKACIDSFRECINQAENYMVKRTRRFNRTLCRDRYSACMNNE